MKTELEELNSRKKLSEEEESRRLKYTQFLMQYEQKQKLRLLKETHKKLKMREKELSKEEQKKLQAKKKKKKILKNPKARP